jgi:hypothetical protein
MKKHFIQSLFVLTAILLLVAGVLFIQFRIAEQAGRPGPVATEEVLRPSVSVVMARGATYTALVTGYGEASAHYALTHVYHV